MIRFTKEEKIALIFIIFAMLVGTAVLWHKKLFPGTRGEFEFEEKAAPETSAKININEAGLQELARLKCVGPVLAERIISHREKYGRFIMPEDVKKVKGIGEKTYQKIKDKITLE